ncbi:MAG: tetratricopeptide repeat protein [Oligoflexia bacterium]|nr:tetratricopeptide repeat protein [Oligoflexia bacterium]MBF0366257.1 tetratricopeptide repeat protein [Oligoflexia bacterium]
MKELIIQASEANTNYRLGKIHHDKADLLTAEKYFLKSVEEWRYPEDIFFSFKVLGFLVRIAAELLDQEKTEKYISLSEKFLERVRRDYPRQLTAEFYYNDGIISSYRTNLQDAINTFTLAANKAREENSPEVLAKAMHALALSYFNRGEYEKSLQYLDDLRAILEILHKGYLTGTMYYLYGNIYAEVGQYKKSIESYQAANDVLKDKFCWHMYARTLTSMGIVYKKMGEFNKSLTHFELAQHSINSKIFRKLQQTINHEIGDVAGVDVDIVLDHTNRMVYERNLGPIDFKHRFILLEILFLLAQHPGDYYDKEGLAKSIWRDEYNPLVHDKLIYTSVSRLRKLIEPRKNKRSYIIRGPSGYAFNPKIKVRLHKDNELDTKGNIYGIEISTPA